MKKKSVIFSYLFIITMSLFSIAMFNPFSSSAADDFDKGKDFTITLRRSACLGNCPDYNLTIHSDGKVVYVGNEYVKTLGTQTAVLSREKILALVKAFKEADFFSMDSFRGGVNDVPITYIEVKINDTGAKYSVVTCPGCGDYKKSLELADTIDEIVNSDQWTDVKETFKKETARINQSQFDSILKDMYSVGVITLDDKNKLQSLQQNGSSAEQFTEQLQLMLGAQTITLEPAFTILNAFLTSRGLPPSDGINVPVVQSRFKVGDYYQGGIIFWLDQSKVEAHGLIVDVADKPGLYLWSDQKTIPNVGADRDGSYAGKYNTAKIYAASAEHFPAAFACISSKSGGYADWYLPSAKELYLIRYNRYTINQAVKKHEGAEFVPGKYWSSTQNSDDLQSPAMADFGGGYQGGNHPRSVRCVREF